MTHPTPDFRRADFESLLDEHRRLIGLANEVEFHLHALAGVATEENLRALQQSAGTLVSVVRSYVFRVDQQVLPVVDRFSRSEEGAG